jgi:hypothetical protein
MFTDKNGHFRCAHCKKWIFLSRFHCPLTRVVCCCLECLRAYQEEQGL